MTITATPDDLARIDNIVRELLEDASYRETRRTDTEVQYEGSADDAYWILDLTPRHAILTLGRWYREDDRRETERTLTLDNANDVLFLESVVEDPTLHV